MTCLPRSSASSSAKLCGSPANWRASPLSSGEISPWNPYPKGLCVVNLLYVVIHFRDDLYANTICLGFTEFPCRRRGESVVKLVGVVSGDTFARSYPVSTKDQNKNVRIRAPTPSSVSSE